MAATTSRKINEIYTFGPFRVDVAERLLLKNGELVPLPGRAYDLLLDFVQNAGHLRTRAELIEALWPDTIVEETGLTWNVNALRRALGDHRRNPTYVETVHGQGYRFIAPVEVEQPNGGADVEAVGSAAIAAGTAVPTENIGSAGESEGVGDIAAEAAPTGQRRVIWGLAGALIVVIAGVLIWQFVPFGSRTNGEPDTPVIAVMPFENLSSDPNNAYLAEGIQDTILSKLAGIGGLRVISRASTKRYPSHPAKLGKIVTELGATAILEGSVQKSGDRMMANVQLIDVATNEHIWAHVYTRSLNDVFAVESDVATQVATSLKAKLLPGEATRLASKPTHDPQAYLLLLKANYYANQIFWGSGTTKDSVATLAQAVALYHQAIVRDSHFALAWARLSLLEIFQYGTVGNAKMGADAKYAADQALATEPDLPEARLAKAYVKYFLDGDLTGALAQLEHIPEQFRDDNAEISGAMALIHFHQGKWQKTLAEYRRAIMLDPRNPRWPLDIGMALTMLRHYAQAESRFNQALALEPDDYYAAVLKIMMLLAAGKPMKQVRRVVAAIPPTSAQKGLVHTLQFEIARLSRQPQAALNALKDTPDWVTAPNAKGKEPVALLRAQAWEAVGDKKKARQAYEKARNMLQTALQSKPKGSRLWSFLGLALAGLGQKAQAIAAGLKAASLTPVSKDAVEGPSHLIILAKIYTQVGKPRQAIKLLRRLLEMPAGYFMSVPLLERDPVWDPLRKSPVFQALLKEYGSKQAPTPAS